jgi:hypothetical protein
MTAKRVKKAITIRETVDATHKRTNLRFCIRKGELLVGTNLCLPLCFGSVLSCLTARHQTFKKTELVPAHSLLLDSKMQTGLLASQFEPEKAADAEYRMWRAHFEKDKSRLVAALIDMLRFIYGADVGVAQAAAKHYLLAAKAHDARNWDSAVDELRLCFSLLFKYRNVCVDPGDIGRAHVKWIRLHDDLEFVVDKTPLCDAIAQTCAFEFGGGLGSVKAFEAAASAKVLATQHHDAAESPSTPSAEVEGHWQACAKQLFVFYQELNVAVTLLRRGDGTAATAKASL